MYRQIPEDLFKDEYTVYKNGEKTISIRNNLTDLEKMYRLSKWYFNDDIKKKIYDSVKHKYPIEYLTGIEMSIKKDWTIHALVGMRYNIPKKKGLLKRTYIRRKYNNNVVFGIMENKGDNEYLVSVYEHTKIIEEFITYLSSIFKDVQFRLIIHNRYIET